MPRHLLASLPGAKPVLVSQPTNAGANQGPIRHPSPATAVEGVAESLAPERASMAEAWAVDPADVEQTTAFDVESGSLAALAAGAVALDPGLADALDAGVGDRVGVNDADGTPRQVQVVAIVRLPDPVRALVPRAAAAGPVHRVLVSYDESLTATQRSEAESQVAAVADAAGAVVADAANAASGAAESQETVAALSLTRTSALDASRPLG